MNDILIAGLVSLGRGVSGWLENSLKDGKIQKIEWARLISTALNVCVYTAAVYFGLTAFGIDATVLAASLSGAALDLLESKWTK